MNDTPLVFAFDFPHKIGSVCGPDCTICGPETDIWGVKGARLPKESRLFIVAEATKQDWVNNVKALGGDASLFAPFGYFYYVSSD